MNHSHSTYSKESLENERIIGSYSYSCYITKIIEIIEIPEEKKVRYEVQYNSQTFSHLKDFYLYENKVRSILEKYVLQKGDFCTFDQLYNHLTKNKYQQIDVPSEIRIPVLFRVLNLEKIGSLLIDDQIDEIYLDSCKKNIYLDHSRYGRCITDISLTQNEVEAFIQRVALENDFSLNRANPTMKSDFFSSLFHTRVTVDIPPLIIDDIHIDIRKFHYKKLKLSDLINLQSITSIQAIFLSLLIRNQISMSIIGPPNSGKTTLQNAIIDYIPSYLRLLSVEDVLESTESRKGNRVRFRLGYDPKESMLFSKSLEVQKILHRSPDFINLGELSTKGHFNAYLNVLSVGIPSIQTIHGRNPKSLFSRLKDIYNIPLELLKASFPHIFLELDVRWIGKMKNRSVIGLYELTDKGEVVPLYDSEIKSFFSKPCIETNIFTLKYLIKRNQINLDTFSEDLKEITLDLCANHIFTVEEVS